MAKKWKVAVCDDNVFDRDITKIYFEDYMKKRGRECEIDCFSSGDEFLASKLSEYTVVILDIYMAGINGVETAREIVKENPDMKIIFCSSSPEFVQDAIEIDVYKYFIKPIIREKFNQVMDEIFAVGRKRKF